MNFPPCSWSNPSADAQGLFQLLTHKLWCDWLTEKGAASAKLVINAHLPGYGCKMFLKDFIKQGIVDSEGS